MDNASEGISVFQDGIIKFANKKAIEITGYTLDELNTMPAEKLMHPDDRETVMNYHRKRLKGEHAPLSYFIRFTDKQGNIKWLHRNTATIIWDGKPAALLFDTDVSEQKRIETQLQQNETRYYELFHRMSSGVAVYEVVNNGADIIFKDFNQSAEKIEKISKEKVIGRSVLDVFPNVKDFGLYDVFLRVWRTGQPEHFPMTEYADNRIRGWRENFIYKLPSDEIVAIYNDITEQKQAEETLRLSENRFRILAETSPDFIVQTDEFGNMLYASPASKNISGFNADDIIGRNYTELVSPQSLYAAQNIYDKVSSGAVVRNVEIDILHRDGSTVSVEISGVPIYSNGKVHGIYGVARDISERINMIDKLQNTMRSIIKAMVRAVEMRDPYTAGHQERVTKLSYAIGVEMGIPEEKLEGLKLASMIHDIGKISVPSEILSKPGKLTDVEYEMIKMHPGVGYEILKDIEFPWPVADIVLQHHERINGTGYPAGLREESILLEAKILAVADVVEAISSHRPYRPALGINKALDDISQNKGSLYDTGVADSCLKLLHENIFKFEDTVNS